MLDKFYFVNEANVHGGEGLEPCGLSSPLCPATVSQRNLSLEKRTISKILNKKNTLL